MIIDAKAVNDRYKIFKQKSPILKKAKHAEVTYETHNKQKFSLVFIFLVVQSTPYKIVDDSRQPQQEDERWIPRCIKNIAGDQEIYFFYFPQQPCCIVQEEHDEKENDEGV